MLKKIDHIGIVVADLASARDFFLALGFTAVRGGPLQGEWIDDVLQLSGVKAEYVALSLPETQTNIELLTFYAPEGSRESSPNKSNLMGIRHIALEVNNIESTIAALKKKGITFFSDIKIYNGGKKLCYFWGIEGIILELAEYF
ncbi:glyoxalase [Ktedonobacter sp. SOSP1-85]|uniref:VOC family protein n=1 Tax=Ktedonobacter sp. SOSP1-85 TaxID=2778367 RepID=UPI001915C44F|nr:VOC family protein [Ktedonobacter sp. SOSP1-85]GHO79615.1 glyoxalase [Ktedonobacter sp. SOSP1-85]